MEGLREVSDPARAESLLAGLASQFLAAIPEHPNADDLVGPFAQQTFWAHRLGDDTLVRRRLRAIVGELLDETHGALAVAASPLHLTPFGQAANITGFSPQSCRRIADFLQQPRVVGDGSLADLGSALLRALGTLPEQTHQNLRKVLLRKSSPVAVKPDDFVPVLNSWLGGFPLEHIFAELPYVLRSTRRPKIHAWLDGSSDASAWNAEFDKFVDFTTAVVEGFLPWLMRACGRLSTFTGRWATEIPWKEWADKLESRVDPA